MQAEATSPAGFAAVTGYALLPKPRYSEPCNHCGLCCRLSLCHVGELAFPKHKSGPCPALMEAADGSLCGLVLMEKESGAEPMIRKQLGIGCGCSMEDDDTTEEQAAAFDARSRARVYGHSAGDQRRDAAGETL